MRPENVEAHRDRVHDWLKALYHPTQPRPPLSVKGKTVATDETWIGETDAARRFGRALSGERVDIHVEHIYHQKRWCVLAGCTSEGIIHDATLVTQEKMVTEVYTEWFRDFVDTLQPGMAVLIDNAPFHDFPALTQLADAKGVFLLPTPPRCPEDNPIELVWAAIDKLIQAAGRDIFKEDPVGCIKKALYNVTATEVGACFRHCGLDGY